MRCYHERLSVLASSGGEENPEKRVPVMQGHAGLVGLAFSELGMSLEGFR